MIQSETYSVMLPQAGQKPHASLSATNAGQDAKKTAEAARFHQAVESAFREETRTAGLKTVTPAGIPAADGAESGDAAEGGFISFIKMVLDVINPLQHIPVVSAIYRHITGDEITPAARLAGGTLFGGPVGAAMAAADIAAEGITGKDLGGTAMAMLEQKDTTTEIAQNSSSPSAPAPTSLSTSVKNEPPATLSLPTAPPAAHVKSATVAADPTLPPRPRGDHLSYAGKNAGGLVSAASIPALHFQETPADGARTASPPENPYNDVPARMMEALDKYGAMQRARTAGAGA